MNNFKDSHNTIVGIFFDKLFDLRKDILKAKYGVEIRN